MEAERSILEDPEFETLRNTPSTVRRAVVYYPTDPRGFLRKRTGIPDAEPQPAFLEHEKTTYGANRAK
jgi:hypothetical protein